MAAQFSATRLTTELCRAEHDSIAMRSAQIRADLHRSFLAAQLSATRLLSLKLSPVIDSAQNCTQSKVGLGSCAESQFPKNAFRRSCRAIRYESPTMARRSYAVSTVAI